MIARLQAWSLALLGVISTVLLAFGWGRWRGQRAASDHARDAVDGAEQRAVNAEHTLHHTEIRADVVSEVIQLPASDTTRAGDAAADSAAARLRDDWSRD